LGAALCPCDGKLPAHEYRRVVDHILEGISLRSELILAPLSDRMRKLASEQRYEEAGWARDRHEALARSIERRRSWIALGSLGLCEMESQNGAHVVLDHGRLVSTWVAGSAAPLRPAPEISESPGFDVPESVEAAEEAHLIWRWMESNSIRLLDATGSLALPYSPVASLSTGSSR
jgi:DNA polymerase-3 subunit epsilon